MKKTFPLQDPVHKPARVVESIKNQIRKYVKRERRKSLPEGVDFWDFDCRVGESSDTAEKVHVDEVIKKVDLASESDWAAVYVEILATPGHRIAGKTESDTDEPIEQNDDSDEELLES